MATRRVSDHQGKQPLSRFLGAGGSFDASMNDQN